MSPHGTTSRYVAGKCRCEECSDAWRYYMADYRARRRAGSSGAAAPKHIKQPGQKSLDSAVDKVGQDFPSIGAILRLSWTGAA